MSVFIIQIFAILSPVRKIGLLLLTIVGFSFVIVNLLWLLEMRRLKSVSPCE